MPGGAVFLSEFCFWRCLVVLASLASGSSFSSFLSSLGVGAPVVCFGSRSAPPSVLSVARGVGSLLAGSGHPVFSGGAVGCDAAFVAGARSAAGSGVVFRPVAGSGVRGLFARSARSLRVARSRGGAAVVFVPSVAFASVVSGGSCPGGSAWSARCALRLGVPLLLVGFSPSGSVTSWSSHFFAAPPPSRSRVALAASKLADDTLTSILGPRSPYKERGRYSAFHASILGKRTLFAIRAGAILFALVCILACVGVIPTTQFSPSYSHNLPASNSSDYTDYYDERR